ncbi:hypothetical protein O6P43_003621 [Quillaja saponaria]|uniref:Uncharacterized protein n=1 Tax=Quillaja saponaria TaxID=32244 RepID=A0AAD7VLZ9_QUISA|nr:hypothetical protein O6P43_003621 [Quillaja saponaria]
MWNGQSFLTDMCHGMGCSSVEQIWFPGLMIDRGIDRFLFNVLPIFVLRLRIEEEDKFLSILHKDYVGWYPDFPASSEEPLVVPFACFWFCGGVLVALQRSGGTVG